MLAHSRVVDEAVDPAERGQRRGDDPGRTGAIGQVGRYRDGLAAGLLDRVGALPERGLPPADQYHRLVIKGFPAWLMHRGYHVLAVPTWERKIRVLAIWLTAALFGRDIVSLASVQHPREAFITDGELAFPARAPERTWKTASTRASAHSVDICSE